MFKQIEILIFEKNLSKAEIARKLGITYNTFLLKLKGKFKFTLDEAVQLKEILSTDMPIEKLFVFENKSA